LSTAVKTVAAVYFPALAITSFLSLRLVYQSHPSTKKAQGRLARQDGDYDKRRASNEAPLLSFQWLGRCLAPMPPLPWRLLDEKTEQLIE
jgi:hypothetical protein